MPYSFTKIEEDKTKTITLVFAALIFFYFAVFWVLSVLAVNFFLYQNSDYRGVNHFAILNFPQSMVIFGIAFIVGYTHWQYTVSQLVTKILGVLKAEQLDPNDTYHQMFENIVEEVMVATGGRKMEAVVIPTMAMNAFAIADFSGRAVVGVTEGLLFRLNRAQIEAVVGHEAAHIVSGDCFGHNRHFVAV